MSAEHLAEELSACREQLEEAHRELQRVRAGAASACAAVEKELLEARRESRGASIPDDDGPLRAQLGQLRMALAAAEEARATALRDASTGHAAAAVREARATELEAQCAELEARCARAETHAAREAEALGQDLFVQEREALCAVEAEIRRREARLVTSQELLAAELADAQALLQGQEPFGEAVMRLGRERQRADGERAEAELRVSSLEKEVARLRTDNDRLRARNAALLERERSRRAKA